MRPGEYKDKELFFERITPSEDPSIPAGHGRVIAHSRVAFYVDSEGTKKRIALDFAETLSNNKQTFACDTNTLKSKVDADGWIFAECVDGYLSYRLCEKETAKPGLPGVALKRLPAKALSAFTREGRKVTTGHGDISITTKSLPGELKDTVVISKLPAKTDLEEPFGVVFEYASDLVPRISNAEVLWATDTLDVLKWKAPSGWDANNVPVPLEYSVDAANSEITLSTTAPVGEYELPLYFDPTTTTAQVDATANRSVYQGLFPDDESFYTYAFIKITAPAIPGAVTGATLDVVATVSGGTVGFIISGDTGLTWDETSTAATLKALDPTVGIATTSESSSGSKSYDITAFATDAYAGGTPSPFTFEFRATDPSPSPPSDNLASTSLTLGEDGTGTYAKMGIANRSDATDYPRVVLNYSAVGTITAYGTPSLLPVISYPRGTAAIKQTSSGIVFLGKVASSGTAIVAQVVASGSPALETLTSGGAAKVFQIKASGTPDLQALTSEGVAGITRKASGTPDLLPITVSGASNVYQIGASGTPSLTALTSTGVAKVLQVSASGSPSLQAVSVAGIAKKTVVVRTRSSGAQFPQFTAEGVVHVPRHDVYGTPSMPSMTMTGTVGKTVHVSGFPNFPSMETTTGIVSVVQVFTRVYPVITHLGGTEWQFDWSHNIDQVDTTIGNSVVSTDANAPYQGWVTGERLVTGYSDLLSKSTTFLIMTTGTSYDPPVLEILDADDIAIGRTSSGQKLPPTVAMQWERVDEASQYKVEQYTSGSWSTIATMISGDSSYFSVNSPVLEDVTTHQFRITALDAGGNSSIVRLANVFMVRYPATPVVTGTYSAVSGDLTILARS
jgi:hypothetical protein